MRSGKNNKASWLVMIVLGWCAAIGLVACAVDDPAVREEQQENLNDPPWETICGDGLCSGRENITNCPEDCTPVVPVVCGDGLCSGTENWGNCPADCPLPSVCGDGTCDPGENCPVDCVPPVCGDCICSAGEVTSCPYDCNLPNQPTWCIFP
jgi:hypothetical protein